MLKCIMVVSCLSLLAVLIGGCGGGEKENPFIPRAVSPEYEGLSVEELKVKSSGLTWADLGCRQKTIERTGEDGDCLTGHADGLTGQLIWFEGKVDKKYEGTQPGTYQIWICTAETGRSGVDCNDTVLLIYSLDRGPEVNAKDKVRMAGILTGSHGYNVSFGGGGGTTLRASPVVSVIRLELADVVIPKNDPTAVSQ